MGEGGGDVFRNEKPSSDCKRGTCQFWSGLGFAVVVEYLVPVLQVDTDLVPSSKQRGRAGERRRKKTIHLFKQYLPQGLCTDLDDVQAELHHVLITGTVVPCSSVHLQSITVERGNPW